MKQIFAAAILLVVASVFAEPHTTRPGNSHLAAADGSGSLINERRVNHASMSQDGHKLVQFQMALLKRGQNWASVDVGNPPDVIKQHQDYEQSLLKTGKAMIAGRIADDGELRGVYIFRTATPDEAKTLVLADPAVIAGHFKVEMHPWLSEDVMKKTTPSLKTNTAYLVLLTRGAKWTPGSTPETEELQKKHIANIIRLAELKKLVVAGPFADDGTLRGIFVFKVDSLDEAKSLTATDPAVMAGRLGVEIHPWVVPEGILP